MGTFDSRAAKAGNFLNHRSLSGAAAADSTTYNTTNFPPTSAFHAPLSLSIFATWAGTGGAITDTIDIEPLIFDSINSIWYRLAVVQLRMQELKEIRVCGSGLVFLRINATATTATNLQIRAAMGEVEHALNS